MTTKTRPDAASVQTDSKATAATAATLAAVRAATDLPIDDAAIDAHQLSPSQLAGMHTFRGLADEPNLRSIELPAAPPALLRGAKHLNVDKFGKALHAALRSDVVGYAMGMRQNGVPIYGLQWNWAQVPIDGSKGWNGDTAMHVASVSKLITGIAMVRLLGEKNISYDAKIVAYLPTYWQKGANVDQITFRQLLTHRSGFAANGATTFADMKAKVAQGVTAAALGQYAYENMNFGLCRVLLAVINGNIAKGALVGDLGWDVVTISAYASYMTAKVFAPCGAAGTLTHEAGDALAYQFPPVSPGWNSGNLGGVSGGAGWHMSINSVLKVMDAFRRKGTIVGNARAQAAMDSGFGLDVVTDTPAGRLYNKNGRWTDGVGRTEQALAYFLPENMELVVYANSPISLPAKFFRSVVTDLYMANLV